MGKQVQCLHQIFLILQFQTILKKTSFDIFQTKQLHRKS
jgi:hypothetical protein